MSSMTTTTGFVLFRLGERTFAAVLDDVREIVRLEGLQPLPGAEPPLAGVIVLRGSPLPVLDVRQHETDDDRGDVLVMDVDGETVGVAVDGVVAVLPPEELPHAEEAGKSLPGYVVGVRRHGQTPVLMVDLHKLIEHAHT
jgi:chemotaxis signal transduction protein